MSAPVAQPSSRAAFEAFELVAVMIFTVEYLMRFIAAPSDEDYLIYQGRCVILSARSRCAFVCAASCSSSPHDCEFECYQTKCHPEGFYPTRNHSTGWGKVPPAVPIAGDTILYQVLC